MSTGAHDAPFAAGWASAATAVHGIRQFATPMLLALEPGNLPAIVIDPRHRAFAWPLSLSEFPEQPESVSVATQAVSADDPAPFPLPGRPLDALLWMIGRNAFADEAAPWLVHGDRYAGAPQGQGRRPPAAVLGGASSRSPLLSVLRHFDRQKWRSRRDRPARRLGA
ncbi:MAG TPA: hypothetical protein VN241_12455 [Microbacterium sp.]|nr:hypothetical protein [Microbacterium sp.]